MVLVWDTACAVGECPTWDERRGCIWFCEIPTGRLHAYGIAHGSRRTFDLPAPLGSFGLCRSGRLVVAIGMRIVLFDPDRGGLDLLADIPDAPDDFRLNDGKVGPDGCFWVGSMAIGLNKPPTAALYRVCPDGSVQQRLASLQLSNGLAWSPDGTTMFHADTRGGWIDAWDFDASAGDLARCRRLATLSRADGAPDGGACDVEGCYWSVGVSATRLNRFSPYGRLLAVVPLPLPAPTMLCFAGDTLYVASLRVGLAPELVANCPALGGLSCMPAPVRGAAIAWFEDVTP